MGSGWEWEVVSCTVGGFLMCWDVFVVMKFFDHHSCNEVAILVVLRFSEVRYVLPTQNAIG